MAFASQKFDLETMQCKESGSNIDDVVKYVRQDMYKLLKQEKKTSEEEDDDDEVISEADTEEQDAAYATANDLARIYYKSSGNGGIAGGATAVTPKPLQHERPGWR